MRRARRACQRALGAARGARAATTRTSSSVDARASPPTRGATRRRRPPTERALARLPPTTLTPRRGDRERYARSLREQFARCAVVREREHGVPRATRLTRDAPGGTTRALERLRRRAGADAYVVGGAVRDWIALGERAKPRDVDLVTSATYEEIEAAMDGRAKVVGRRFRVALVRANAGRWIEVASFESEGEGEGEGESEEDATRADAEGAPVTASGETDYDAMLRRRRAERAKREATSTSTTSSRRASTTETIAEDGSRDDFARLLAVHDNARRRDFTVNAMYYDPWRNEILDFHGGMNDTHAGVVRTVGDTNVSLREDPVRMLRAIRLAARHGFTMTKELRAALRAYAATLASASPRRVASEIETLMQNGYSEASFKLLWHSTLMKYAFPVQHEFFKPRLPNKSSLTYDLESLVSPNRDFDGGARVLFDALKAYDGHVSDDISKSSVAQWLAIIVAPVAMHRMATRRDSEEDPYALPPRWSDVDAASRDEVRAHWNAFTASVLDVFDEMLERTAAETRDGGRTELSILNRSECASALLLLLAHGPVFADAPSGDLKWRHASFESLVDRGERVFALVKTKRRNEWSDANKASPTAEAEVVRASLEVATTTTTR